LKALALFEITWEEWDEAVKWFTRYQQRCPEDPESYRRIAGIHLKNKQPEKALPQLEQLFRLTLDDAGVALQVAELYGGKGDMKAAATWYEKAMQVDPFDPQTHLGLAEASFEAGEYPIAEREFKVVCALLPKDPQGYEGLGKVYEKLGDSKKAEENAKRAQALGAGAQTEPEAPETDDD
jgi:tetratricopeptide (TPR) repeat protein